MDPFVVVFIAIFVFVVARFSYGRLKHGSWTGSMLGGRIDRTVGEVVVQSGVGTLKLAVHTMRADAANDGFVALVFVAKAPLGASMQPYRLTKEQARELAEYLSRAAQG